MPSPDAPLDIRASFTVKFQFWNFTSGAQLGAGLHLFSYAGECIFDLPAPAVSCGLGLVSGECHIPGNFLNDGSYYLSLIIVKNTSTEVFYFEQCLAFDLQDYRDGIYGYGKWMGIVRPNFSFQLRAEPVASSPTTEY
jgi:lipopolysaccharide transport system ATP-binding protein